VNAAGASVAAPISMPVEIQLATDTDTPDIAAIETWAAGALAAVPAAPGRRPAADGEVCVRIVDSGESRVLNATYRDMDEPTNVLSFPAGIDLPDALIWGDVVICAPVVLREAGEQGKRYQDHFAHMVVHGVLHLFGYDHQTTAEADGMERLEQQILDRFGIGDPYGEG